MSRYLGASDIEVRIGQISRSGKGLSLLLYKDARCDMRILDEIYGSDGWQCRYEEHKGTLFCYVGVYTQDHGWIWKSDAGAPSNMEAEKGEASDAFKRACFRWGIGRELYTAPFIWVTQANIKDDDGRKKCFDKFAVKDIVIEKGRITKLSIINANSNECVYQWSALRAEQMLQGDSLDILRTLLPSYAKARNITNKEATQELCEFANVTDMKEIAEDFIPDVEAYMRQIIGS